MAKFYEIEGRMGHRDEFHPHLEFWRYTRDVTQASPSDMMNPYSTPDVRFHGRRWAEVDPELPHETYYDPEQGKLTWSVEIAKAALIEAGFAYMAASVVINRANRPSYKGPIRTEEEMLAIIRAFRLGAMGDDEAPPVICCRSVPEAILDIILHNGGYMAACDQCAMHF